MDRPFDTQLEEIRGLILAMGGLVEHALEGVIGALIQRNLDQFEKVHEIENKINEDHVRVDNLCLGFLAKQGPVARDLRFVVSVIKINSDLERMGDQCVNISYTGKDYLGRSPVAQLNDIETMSVIVRKMVKESLDSFVHGDVAKAQSILLMDDEVDSLKSKVFQELLTFLKAHPSHADQIEGALDLILIARNLERLGDHATNIAEDVIFVYTGKDVRHGGKYS